MKSCRGDSVLQLTIFTPILFSSLLYASASNAPIEINTILESTVSESNNGINVKVIITNVSKNTIKINANYIFKLAQFRKLHKDISFVILDANGTSISHIAKVRHTDNAKDYFIKINPNDSFTILYTVKFNFLSNNIGPYSIATCLHSSSSDLIYSVDGEPMSFQNTKSALTYFSIQSNTDFKAPNN